MSPETVETSAAIPGSRIQAQWRPTSPFFSAQRTPFTPCHEWLSVRPVDLSAVWNTDRGTWLLLGICGSGMRSLCQQLLHYGDRVIGSDSCRESLRRLAAEQSQACRQGQLQLVDAADVSLLQEHSLTAVVRSLAVPESPDLSAAAAAAGIPFLTLPQAVAQRAAAQRQLCVAGTHGKTTTSGMLWWILQQAQPTGLFLGGELCSETGRLFAERSRTHTPPVAVIESCEYRRSFLHFRPASAILTGIEPDHFDCFASESELLQAYAEFLALVPADGTVIHDTGCLRSLRLVSQCAARPLGFSLSYTGRAEWCIRDVTPRTDLSAAEVSGSGCRFRMHHLDGRKLFVEIPMPGVHNAKNAAAAILTAELEGVAAEHAVELLRTFPGIRRRFEFRGEYRGALLFDDYAHHPTAIRETLAAARMVYPGRRLLVVFEPHQLERLRRLEEGFAAALSAADQVYVLPVLPAREQVSTEVAEQAAAVLVERIRQSGGFSRLVNSLDRVPMTLDDAVLGGEVVITMGAGRTNTIHDEINRRVQRDFAA